MALPMPTGPMGLPETAARWARLRPSICGTPGSCLFRARVAPLDEDQGHVALGLVLRHLGNTGIFMMATAHPDDEDNGLFVMLNRGQGYRTALASATRGNGGQ